MSHDDIIVDLKKNIEDKFGNASHDYFHHIRVFNNVTHICMKEGIGEDEAFPIKISALLHDIGKSKADYKKYDIHEIASAEIAENILRQYDLSEMEIDLIKDCILNHRTSKETKFDSLSVWVLRDADRLDALGAIAIARTFSYVSYRPIYLPDIDAKAKYDGISESSINHIKEKVLALTPDSFYTSTAKKLLIIDITSFVNTLMNL